VIGPPLAQLMNAVVRLPWDRPRANRTANLTRLTRGLKLACGKSLLAWNCATPCASPSFAFFPDYITTIPGDRAGARGQGCGWYLRRGATTHPESGEPTSCFAFVFFVLLSFFVFVFFLFPVEFSILAVC